MKHHFRAILAVLFLLAIGSAHAQYKVHSWESFEGGVLPETLKFGHNADETTIFPLVYATPGYPAELKTGIAQSECGRYGVLFMPRSAADDFRLHLSLVSPVSLDRRHLGNQGRALYQMDVFLPAEGVKMPNTALLAISSDYAESGSSYVMYRFGIIQAGETPNAYFSYANANAYAADDPDRGRPLIYVQEPLANFNLTRPGWHRFQIIFQGQNQIYCAIDGVPTGFSPVEEPTLRNLTAGIMVTDSETSTVGALVDNLSIQWTNEDVPIPDSPWVQSATLVAHGGGSEKNLFDFNSDVNWLTSPQQAWTICHQQKRPILLMFYSPKVTPYKYLLSIAPNTESVRDKLSKYVLLRVDANQLEGGTLAQKFNVGQIPTFLILGPDGSVIKRMTVMNKQTNWSEIANWL